MHHCFFTSGSWEGHAGWIRWVELGTRLIDIGHSVSYVLDDVPYNRERIAVDQRAKRLYVRSDSGQYLHRRQLFSAGDFDYVHLLNSRPKACAALLGIDHKLVVHWDELETLKKLSPARRLMFQALERWLRRRAFAQIAVTVFLKDHFRTRYDVHTTHIPHAPYLPPRLDGESPYETRTFVYMGTMFPLWDHDVLFDAARQLAERGKRPAIAVIGDGQDLDKWRSFVRSHGLSNVQLPGFLEGAALWTHLRHAHVLLFPIRDNDVNRSRCPSKTFAYAQARRPVVTSRVGEVPLMLGERAIYVDSRPDVFADTIERLMEVELTDVDYGLEQHTWADRCDRMLLALSSAESDAASHSASR